MKCFWEDWDSTVNLFLVNEHSTHFHCKAPRFLELFVLNCFGQIRKVNAVFEAAQEGNLYEAAYEGKMSKMYRDIENFPLDQSVENQILLASLLLCVKKMEVQYFFFFQISTVSLVYMKGKSQYGYELSQQFITPSLEQEGKQGKKNNKTAASQRL